MLPNHVADSVLILRRDIDFDLIGRRRLPPCVFRVDPQSAIDRVDVFRIYLSFVEFAVPGLLRNETKDFVVSDL